VDIFASQGAPPVVHFELWIFLRIFQKNSKRP